MHQGCTEIVHRSVPRGIPYLESKNHSSSDSMIQRICKYVLRVFERRWNILRLEFKLYLSPNHTLYALCSDETTTCYSSSRNTFKV